MDKELDFSSLEKALEDSLKIRPAIPCSISCATDTELARIIANPKFTDFYRDRARYECLQRERLPSHMSIKHNQVVYAYGTREYSEGEVRRACRGKRPPDHKEP